MKLLCGPVACRYENFRNLQVDEALSTFPAKVADQFQLQFLQVLLVGLVYFGKEILVHGVTS